MIRSFVATVLLASIPNLAYAEEKITPKQTWKGSVADENLERAAPAVIVSQKTLDAIWDVWKQPGKAPQLDFAKEIVVLTTSRGSLVNLIVQKSEKDLKVLGFGTRDLRPGFRFVMGSVPREGVATVNGVALPKE